MDKEICVRADMGESQTIKTMIHEVAHAMLHDSDQMKQRGEEKDQLTKETEAESIAFTVCSALGIDTSDYSFPYVASWASGKELKELKDSMDTIRLTAADFLEKLETAVAERSVERMTAMEYAAAMSFPPYAQVRRRRDRMTSGLSPAARPISRIRMLVYSVSRAARYASMGASPKGIICAPER